MQRAARTTPAHRAEVIAYAAEHGAPQAAKTYGHKAETIRSWQSRAGTSHVASETTRAANEARLAKWEERRSTMVHDIGAAAELALTKTTEHLRGGHLRNAKDAATTMAILIDKAQLLSGGHTARFGTDADRSAVLNDAHGKGLSLVSDAA